MVTFTQVYIRNCGAHRIEIGHQMFVMRKLESVAEAVVLGDSKDERKRILKERLSEIVLPTTFKLPLSPHLNVSTFVVSVFVLLERNVINTASAIPLPTL